MQFWWHHPNHARPGALTRHASGFSRQEWTSVAGQHWSWSSFGWWFGGRLPWKLTWDPRIGGFSNGVFSASMLIVVFGCLDDDLRYIEEGTFLFELGGWFGNELLSFYVVENLERVSFSMIHPWLLLDMFRISVAVHLVATVVDNSGDLSYPPPISGVILQTVFATGLCFSDLPVMIFQFSFFLAE